MSIGGVMSFAFILLIATVAFSMAFGHFVYDEEKFLCYSIVVDFVVVLMAVAFILIATWEEPEIVPHETELHRGVEYGRETE